MGFRFHNLKSLYRTSISKLSHTNTHKNKKFHPNPIIFQTLNSHLRTLSDSENHKYNHPVYKIPKRWHLGHSRHGHDQKEQSQQYGKEGENIFRLGLAADIGLAAGKAFTGYLSGSTAIIADAAHSVSDVVNFKVESLPMFYFCVEWLTLLLYLVAFPCCLLWWIAGAMELCMSCNLIFIKKKKVGDLYYCI